MVSFTPLRELDGRLRTTHLSPPMRPSADIADGNIHIRQVFPGSRVGPLRAQRLCQKLDRRAPFTLLPGNDAEHMQSIGVACFRAQRRPGKAFRQRQVPFGMIASSQRERFCGSRHALTFGEKVMALGGLLSTGNHEVEKAVGAAREDAALTKRILFLKRSEQVFHLWHVVHKPFSYTFALLAMIHIGAVLLMGYRW